MCLCYFVFYLVLRSSIELAKSLYFSCLRHYFHYIEKAVEIAQEKYKRAQVKADEAQTTTEVLKGLQEEATTRQGKKTKNYQRETGRLWLM